MLSPPSRRWQLIVALVMMTCAGRSTADDRLPPRFRRPIALTWIEPHLVATANHRSGSVSLVDLSRGVVTDEIVVGRQLSDICALDSNTILTLDSQQHELIVLTRTAGQWQASSRTPVAHTPVSLELSADRTWCSITSLWARQLCFVQLNRDAPPEVVEE